MAIFRIEKKRDFTVMSNHHLKSTTLSLKAVGLLSKMLSLPDNWDYTTKGLARICKDGIDSIRATIKELEEHGYVTRERVRNTKGQLTEIEYTIHEQPNEEKPENTELSPKRENPVLDGLSSCQPERANPVLDSPILENPTQLNTKLSNTNQSNTYLLDSASFIPSSAPDPEKERNEGELFENELKFPEIKYAYLEPMDGSRNPRLEEIKLLIRRLWGKKRLFVKDETLYKKEIRELLSHLTWRHIQWVLQRFNEAAREREILNVSGYLSSLIIDSCTCAENTWDMPLPRETGLNFINCTDAQTSV